MLAFGNTELAGFPVLRAGQRITCSRCKKRHVVVAGTNDKGKKTNTVLFIRCRRTLYLVGVHGRRVF